VEKVKMKKKLWNNKRRPSFSEEKLDDHAIIAKKFSKPQADVLCSYPFKKLIFMCKGKNKSNKHSLLFFLEKLK